MKVQVDQLEQNRSNLLLACSLTLTGGGVLHQNKGVLKEFNESVTNYVPEPPAGPGTPFYHFNILIQQQVKS